MLDDDVSPIAIARRGARMRGYAVRALWGLVLVAARGGHRPARGVVIGSTPGARTAVARGAPVAAPGGRLRRPTRGRHSQIRAARPRCRPCCPAAAPAPPARTRRRGTPRRPARGPSGAEAPSRRPRRRGTPCRANASACVDLSANRAWLISNGKMPVRPGADHATGARASGRPPGTFRVSFKAADHVSSVYDAEMPYSVFFNGGIAFHEGSLKVLSHGCVHLSGKAARRLLRFARRACRSFQVVRQGEHQAQAGPRAAGRAARRESRSRDAQLGVGVLQVLLHGALRRSPAGAPIAPAVSPSTSSAEHGELARREPLEVDWATSGSVRAQPPPKRLRPAGPGRSSSRRTRPATSISAALNGVSAPDHERRGAPRAACGSAAPAGRRRPTAAVSSYQAATRTAARTCREGTSATCAVPSSRRRR